MDERGRQFMFKIVAKKSTGKLSELVVEGIGIQPGADPSLQQLPSVVSRAASIYGVTEIETEPTVTM